VSGVALYGRTYLDAEVTIPLDQLATGKGKVDVEVTASLGGFPCNAARAIGSRWPMTVVTRISSLDLPRLRSALPPGTVIHAVASDSEDWPPVTVIINPAQECRLLRTGRAGDLAASDVSEVPAASIHIFGRVDASLVEHVQRAAPHAVTAWCAGASAELDRCDLACVNTAEARQVLGRNDGTPRELAIALVGRAKPGSVRVVTGRGDAPTAAATHSDVFESAPAPIPREHIKTFKGVGDVFATHFFVEVALGKLAIDQALAVAQAAAGRFMQR
jgi:hypothetical protein